MHFVFKTIILSLVVVIVVNYSGYQKSGNIPARAWLLTAQAALNKVIDKNVTADAKTVQISKWKDGNGVVHYENRPVEGAKIIEVNPNANVLPPMPIVQLPKNTVEKTKTMNKQLRDIQEAKKAHFDALTQ